MSGTLKHLAGLTTANQFPQRRTVDSGFVSLWWWCSFVSRPFFFYQILSFFFFFRERQKTPRSKNVYAMLNPLIAWWLCHWSLISRHASKHSPSQSPTHRNCMSLSQFVCSSVSVIVKGRMALSAAWDLLCQTSRTFEGASSTFHSSLMMPSAVEGLHLCFYVCVCFECSHGSVDWYYLPHFIRSEWKLVL